MPRSSAKDTVLRRSFALPKSLVAQAQTCVAPEQRGNLNGLLKLALEEFVKQRRYLQFKRSIRNLGQDPKSVEEHLKVANDFAFADEDSLK